MSGQFRSPGEIPDEAMDFLKAGGATAVDGWPWTRTAAGALPYNFGKYGFGMLQATTGLREDDESRCVVPGT